MKVIALLVQATPTIYVTKQKNYIYNDGSPRLSKKTKHEVGQRSTPAQARSHRCLSSVVKSMRRGNHCYVTALKDARIKAGNKPLAMGRDHDHRIV